MELHKARGATGTIDVLDPAQGGQRVARVLWFGDAFTGDWEWQILPEDPALRRRLDEFYALNENQFDGVNFGAFSGRRAVAWTTYEGTLGALNLALPGIGLCIGPVEFPPDALRTAGDVVFDLYAHDAAVEAEGEVQLLREQRTRAWEFGGEEPPPVDDAAEVEALRAAERAAVPGPPLETEV